METQETGYDFAVQDPAKLARILSERRKQYRDTILKTGLAALWRRSFVQYNNGLYTKGKLLRAGSHGQLTEMSVNDFRNILLHMRVIATSPKPSFETRSGTMDYKNRATQILAPGLLEYYLNNGDLGPTRDRVADMGLVYGIGFLHTYFDKTSGERVGEITKGDVRFGAFGPFQATFDVTSKTSQTRNQWIILTDYVNKWDQMAIYPDNKEGIMNAKDDDHFRFFLDYDLFKSEREQNKDLVPIHYFYHEKSAALPEGRQVIAVGDTIVFDGPLVYEDIPVSMLIPWPVDRSRVGYTPAFDLLPIQRMSDITVSSAATNISTFGVQNIAMLKGSDINHKTLAGNMNVIEVPHPQAIPQAVNLLSVPAIVTQFYEILNKKKETISGINATVRGNPPASLESGAALALLSSQAIQFVSDFQGACVKILEKTGFHLLKILSIHVTDKRKVAMVGKLPGQYVKEFTGGDLEGIKEIVVSIGNPLMQTAAGRYEIANNLLKSGAIKDPKIFIEVLSTGSLNAVLAPDVIENMRREAENEELLGGGIPIVNAFDDHAQDLKSHTSLLSTPEARKDPELVKRIRIHCEDHIFEWKAANPDILMVLGLTPPFPVALPGQMMPGEGKMGPDMGPPPGPPGVGGPPPGVLKPPGGPPPGMPNMPTNPLSKEKFNPVTGGIPQGK